MNKQDYYRQVRLALLQARHKTIKHVESIFNDLIDRFSEDEIRGEKELNLPINGKKEPILFVDDTKEEKEK
jgi:hypothetical protein